MHKQRPDTWEERTHCQHLITNTNCEQRDRVLHPCSLSSQKPSEPGDMAIHKPGSVHRWMAPCSGSDWLPPACSVSDCSTEWTDSILECPSVVQGHRTIRPLGRQSQKPFGPATNWPYNPCKVLTSLHASCFPEKIALHRIPEGCGACCLWASAFQYFYWKLLQRTDGFFSNILIHQKGWFSSQATWCKGAKYFPSFCPITHYSI